MNPLVRFLVVGIFLAALGSVSWSLRGCSRAVTTYDALFVEVHDPESLRPTTLSFHLIQGEGPNRRVLPRDESFAARLRFDVSRRDLAESPFLVRITPGDRFQGTVTVVVLASTAQGVVGRAIGSGDLGARGLLSLSLEGIDPACDQDRDGFPDCGIPSCCEPGEAWGDCDDSRAAATPVGFEDDCSRCDFAVGGRLPEGAVDDDCDGTPAICRDVDQDQSLDCLPTWCGEESIGTPACLEIVGTKDCDEEDPTIHPGALERCDGKDNDCDGLTDEDLVIRDWEGSLRVVGDPCGAGRCAGGKVVCDDRSALPVCSTSSLRAETEDCDTPEDDNCNGVANDPIQDGCFEGDADGDGVPDELERLSCPENPDAPYDAGVFPELAYDGAPRHSGPEPCCLVPPGGTAPVACDRNCDGRILPCAPDDRDGDGYPEGPDTDCDDGDPTVHAGAPERCGDGIDQDCRGGDLSCTEIHDGDGDGYAASHGDCDDRDPTIHPGASERCNGKDDDCDGQTDEGNPEALFARCGSDVGECRPGRSVCFHEKGKEPVIRCVGSLDPAPETCNGRDDDCDGRTDEDFAYDQARGVPCLDAGEVGDCPGMPRVGRPCHGRGVCGDENGDAIPDRFGTVVCLDEGNATCSTNPEGPESRALAEVCNDLDDDCDGQTDEDLVGVAPSDCRKTGVCLTGASFILARCERGSWRCDYRLVPDWDGEQEIRCDDLDNDCDGETDEDFWFEDPYHASRLRKGSPCGRGVCAGGRVVCASDRHSLTCSTYDSLRGSEACDGLDNDCDGETDEDFGIWNDPRDPGSGRVGCTGTGECARRAGRLECLDRNRVVCSTDPGGSESLAVPETCNDRDDDCDGQTDEDLTSVEASTCRRVGVCGGDGTRFIQARCHAGSWICDYSEVPFWDGEREARCDGRDNDCDGSTDEDFLLLDWDGSPRSVGEPCGTGRCQGGIAVCDGTRLVCSSAVLAGPEVCNGWDDDCDGLVDEDQVLQGSLPGGPCRGIGECGRQPGVVECHPVDWVPVCSTDPGGSTPLASPEICNGKDDDCNGITDDGLGILSPDCPCLRVGVCLPTTVVARCFDGFWSCDYRNVPFFETPTERSCDGRDNDCDGMTDEDFLLRDWDGSMIGVGRSCGTGRCASGVVLCTLDGLGVECSTAGLARSETCNALDDDCDGITDEGADGSCADSLACTDDLCQEGTCRHPVRAGWCLIDGTTCVPDGTGHPANPCLWCQSSRSPTGWSPRPDDPPCDADQSGCTLGDSCREGVCLAGPPVVCPSPNAPCKVGVCVPQGSVTYTCEERPANPGGVCDDGNDCSYDDRCLTNGTCRGISYSCSDGRHCTSDRCDGLGGCEHELLPGTCLIGGICRNEGETNPVNPCLVCDPATPSEWSVGPDRVPCQDGNPCTLGDECLAGQCMPGIERDCDDGNPCTEDRCDPSTPSGDPCVHTDLLGSPCNDSDLCTYQDLCLSGGICRGTSFSCAPIAPCYIAQCTGLPPPHHCSQTLDPGYCFIAQQCVANGQTNGSRFCQVCDVSRNQSSWSYTPGTCFIAQTCYQEGDRNPENDCQSCQPGVSQSSWRPLTGVSCDDGKTCTTEDLCQSGTCVGTNVCTEPNPVCTTTGCVCKGTIGQTICELDTANRCDATTPTGTCLCGSGPACTPPERCVDPGGSSGPTCQPG